MILEESFYAGDSIVEMKIVNYFNLKIFYITKAEVSLDYEYQHINNLHHVISIYKLNNIIYYVLMF